jgi:hypothetical protein
MMEDAGDWKPGTSFRDALLRLVDDMFPTLDERQHMAELCARFEAKNLDGVVVNLKDATIMKLFCDAYFLRTARQKAENRYRKADVTEQPPASPDAATRHRLRTSSSGPLASDPERNLVAAAAFPPDAALHETGALQSGLHLWVRSRGKQLGAILCSAADMRDESLLPRCRGSTST